jgi:hypothetical protein
MNKYFITASVKDRDTASSLSSYFHTEQELKRPQILLALTQMFQEEGAQVSFIESKESVIENNPSRYYGNIETVLDDKGNISKTHKPVSVSIAKLPNKITKNKVYILEAKTE